MFQPSSDEAQVTFQDASTYFPDAEWRLLQEWQKELYVNVMREIHQALTSLGPLIANTVFSLRAKAAQDLCHVGIPLSGKRNGVNASPSDPVTKPDEGFSMKRERNLRVNQPRDKLGRKRKDCLSPDEDPASIFIDHLGKEVWESNIDTNSGHETISIIIKDEEEPYCIDDPGSKRNKSTNNSACEPGSTLVKTEEDKAEETQSRKEPEPQQKAAVAEIGSRNINAVYSVPGAENSLVRKALLEKAKATEVRSSEKGPGPSSSPLWLRNPHDLEGEKSAPRESGRMRPEHSQLQQAASNIQTSDTRNDFDRNLWKANLLTCQQNANIIVRPFACPECEAFFKTKQELVVHQRTHVVIQSKPQLAENSSQERPHTCAICGNSFRLRHHLIQHQRTHTGERPYECTECNKRFTLKGNLNMHMRTHMVVYEAKHP
ncbi:uncharacterized protein LOC144770910 [Lissotriton helveticus]